MKRYLFLLLLISTAFRTLAIDSAFAREINYTGNEVTVYVKPGDPTQIAFPGKVEGGFKRKGAPINLEKQDNYLVLFAQPELSVEGEAIIIHLSDKRTYSVRLLPALDSAPRDGYVEIVDQRPPVTEETEDSVTGPETGYGPKSAIARLMREMVLVAEFGKKKAVAGFRRSNKYTGETVLHDGSIDARIDEIFMGPDLWGYVLTVTNLLQTSQRINPATFRLDGTRAVSAQHWELAPRPLTSEQQISRAHTGKVYIITKSMRR